MRPERSTALLAAIGVAGALLVLLRQAAYGVGLVLDSPWYLSTARKLAEGAGFVRWNGEPYEGAAPLFPMALALPALFRAHPAEAAAYLNAAAFGLTVFTAGMWLRCRTESRAIAAWGACACALSLTLARNAATVQTEMPFILCAVVALFALDRFLDGRRRAFLLLAALAAALACLTRYVGVAVVAAALPLLLAQRGVPLPDRARNAAAYAAVALAPLGAWALRNMLAVGSPTGAVRPTGFSLLDSLHVASTEFSVWAFGETGFGILSALSGAVSGAGLRSAAEPASVADVSVKIAVLLALAVGAAAALARLRRAGRAPDPVALAVPAAFVLAYLILLSVQLPLGDVNLPARYLAPLYAPALIAAALVLHGCLRHAAARRERLPVPGLAAGARPAWILAGLLALWLIQHAAANRGDIEDWNRDPRHAGRQWVNSETMRYARSHQLDGQIWSNEPPWLYSLAEIREEPRWLSGVSPPEEVVGWIADAVADGRGAHVVWFHGATYGGYGYGLEDLAALPNLAVAAVTEDGAVLAGTEGAAGEAPAAEALLRAALGDARPVARAAFGVYRDGRRLIYVRDGCAAADAAPRFFLHVFPGAAPLLPRPGGRPEFDSLNFGFGEYGFRAGGRCVAVRTLPEHAASVRTGQFTAADGWLWVAEFDLGAARR